MLLTVEYHLRGIVRPDGPYRICNSYFSLSIQGFVVYWSYMLIENNERR